MSPRRCKTCGDPLPDKNAGRLQLYCSTRCNPRYDTPFRARDWRLYNKPYYVSAPPGSGVHFTRYG